jgi:hypothetical protein
MMQYDQGFQTLRIGYAAAVASVTMTLLAVGGLIVGLSVVLTNLRLEIVPWNKPLGTPGFPAKLIGALVLLAAGAGATALIILALRPLIWIWQIGQGTLPDFPMPLQDYATSLSRLQEAVQVDTAAANSCARVLSGRFAL